MKTNIWKFECTNGLSYEDRDRAFAVVFALTKEEATKKGLEQVQKENGVLFKSDIQVDMVKRDVEVPDEIPITLDLKLSVTCNLKEKSVTDARDYVKLVVSQALHDGMVLRKVVGIEIAEYKIV